MALFAHDAKLGYGAYGTRHARARPSVMQWVLAYKAEQVKYRGTRPLRFPRSFPFQPLYTPVSLGWALTRLQASGLAESITRKRGHAASTHYTHRQANLMVSRYTTLVPPLRICIGPGLSTGK